MGALVYVLCTLTSLLSAVLLMRGYLRNGPRLLLWSSLCFFGLTINNLVLFVDIVLVPQMNLYLLRSACAFASVLVLLYGLIWESEK